MGRKIIDFPAQKRASNQPQQLPDEAALRARIRSLMRHAVPLAPRYNPRERGGIDAGVYIAVALINIAVLLLVNWLGLSPAPAL